MGAKKTPTLPGIWAYRPAGPELTILNTTLGHAVSESKPSQLELTILNRPLVAINSS